MFRDPSHIVKRSYATPFRPSFETLSRIISTTSPERKGLRGKRNQLLTEPWFPKPQSPIARRRLLTLMKACTKAVLSSATFQQYRVTPRLRPSGSIVGYYRRGERMQFSPRCSPLVQWSPPDHRELISRARGLSSHSFDDCQT
jgi:hypothetical protein